MKWPVISEKMVQIQSKKNIILIIFQKKRCAYFLKNPVKVIKSRSYSLGSTEWEITVHI